MYETLLTMTDAGLFRLFIAGTLVGPQRGPTAFDAPRRPAHKKPYCPHKSQHAI